MAAVPTIEAPTIPAGVATSAPTISRNPSIGSLCSMGTISLHPAGDRTFAHGNTSHISRAPCSKNCTLSTAERPSSMAQLVDSPMARCPHCSESFSLGKDGNAPKSPETVSENGNLTTETASARLLQTISNLDSTLRKHGADLHHIELMMPRHISRTPSICSTEDLTAGVESKNCLENGTTNAVRSSLLQDHHTSTRFPSNGHSDSDRLAAHPNHHSSLQNVHPLLYDAGDLKLLAASVSRLLKTLNYKVTNITEEEKALREEREVLSQEREIIAKERKELGRLRDEIDIERAELGTQKERPSLDGATSARPVRSGSASSFNLFRSRVRVLPPHPPKYSTSTNLIQNSVEKQSSVENENAFGVPIGPRAVSFDVSQHPQTVWSPEKEDELKELQERLWNANKKWSDEQEEYLETVSRHSVSLICGNVTDTFFFVHFSSNI